MTRLLDWLRDAAAWAADIARGRGQGTGQHKRPAGERPHYEPPRTQFVIPDYFIPGSYASVPLEPLPDGVLTYISDAPQNVPAAATPAPAEAATPARQRPQAPSLPFTGERVPAAPVTPASARPETPNLDQGLWHLRPQQWQDDTGSFKAICEAAA